MKNLFIHPFFNQRNDIIRLFEYLKKHLNSVRFQVMSEEAVFQYVYPGTSFDSSKIRHLRSYLFKLLKEFFAQIELDKNKLNKRLLYTEVLRKKGIAKYFEKETRQIQQSFGKSEFRDVHFYLQNYHLGLQDAILNMPKRRIGKMNFQKITSDLNVFYVSSLLRIACNAQSHQNISGATYDLDFLEEVIQLVEQGNYLDVPAVALYFRCFKAIDTLAINQVEKSEFHFDILKKLIAEHWKTFPASEIRDIYLFAINYCIKRLNAGDRKFIREGFELYRSGLENSTLLEENVISEFTYKNVVRLGMALDEADWVKEFLDEYKKYLSPMERENTWRYNLAFYYFEKRAFKKAMQLLLQVEFKDVLNNMDARRMLLKSYFELGEYSALDSLLDSFYRYIHRKKDLGYHKDNYLNLIRFVKKLIYLRSRDQKSLRDLQNEIEKTNHLAERNWLLEKVQTT